MSLSDTHSGNRVHISFFGMRNAGKSSLVNALTGQDLSVVSDIAGTTTDPVKKSMEILPLGPVLIIDTPGFDDFGSLGKKRIAKTKEIFRQTDIAILVVDSTLGISEKDQELIDLFNNNSIKYLIAFNKIDLDNSKRKFEDIDNSIEVSAITMKNIDALKKKIANFAADSKNKKNIIGDYLNIGDVVILVCPIDESAPKGRIILPQQQVLREILDFNCQAVVCQDTQLENTLNNLKVKPKFVITDSQVFKTVDKIVPNDIPLTSFSILFAQYKGSLDVFLEGIKALENLKDGDEVLIAEACTHHRQCNDIGTVKIPAMINEALNVKLKYSFCSGGEFPDKLTRFKLVIHCGACMINQAEMKSRIKIAQSEQVPIVNYGMLIAKMNGILDRALSNI